MNVESVETETWTVARAKAKLSELIDRARHQGPQLVTRNGKGAVVVVDATQWERIQKREKRGSFADFLLSSPLQGSRLKTTRLPGGVRKIDL